LIVTSVVGRVVQVSANLEDHTGVTPKEALGWPLFEILALGNGLASSGETFFHKGRLYDITRHRITEGGEIVELEPRNLDEKVDSYRRSQAAVAAFGQTKTIRELADQLAESVQKVCGFDRIMIYRFLDDGTGVVISEVKVDAAESYLDIRFPATDIPPQARALYVKNWTRLIADVEYRPVPLLAQDSADSPEALDMSACALRSVSPVHVQYLKNMGVTASMSISLVKDNRLWGLIACHHMSPWYGSRQIRQACELIGQVGSMQINSLEAWRLNSRRDRAREIVNRLTANLRANGPGAESPVFDHSDLLDLVHASGAAILSPTGCTLLGATPSTMDIQRVFTRLSDEDSQGVFSCNSLVQISPDAERFASLASGALAISTTKSSSHRILWFRPEVTETITWAGRPEKQVNEAGFIAPRQSFAAWAAGRKFHSRPWTDEDLEAAEQLRIALLELELTRLAEELETRVQQRTIELQKSIDELNGFTYSVSHDLRTPLRGMVGNSRILLEDYGEEVSQGARKVLKSIESNALKMASLVDDLLSFARLGRQEVSPKRVDVSGIATKAAKKLIALGWPCDGLELTVKPGMIAQGDSNLLDILFTILIENGCKYRAAEDSPKIEIGSTEIEESEVFFVKNSGIGFEMQYAERIFRPFERLHTDAQFPGTGIGLANARRIVERHSGRMWAEGTPGRGATFFFNL
jgi:chemotaxis family two-component system sensor kinase Cph1